MCGQQWQHYGRTLASFTEDSGFESGHCNWHWKGENGKKYPRKISKWLVSGGNRMVEHLPHHPQVKDLSQAWHWKVGKLQERLKKKPKWFVSGGQHSGRTLASSSTS